MLHQSPSLSISADPLMTHTHSSKFGACVMPILQGEQTYDSSSCRRSCRGRRNTPASDSIMIIIYTNHAN